MKPNTWTRMESTFTFSLYSEKSNNNDERCCLFQTFFFSVKMSFYSDVKLQKRLQLLNEKTDLVGHSVFSLC